jgi:hypothetical protein
MRRLQEIIKDLLEIEELIRARENFCATTEKLIEINRYQLVNEWLTYLARHGENNGSSGRETIERGKRMAKKKRKAKKPATTKVVKKSSVKRSKKQD